MSEPLAGLETIPDRARAHLRVFDDGIALIDPVTWRTHVLSPQGFALLAELLQVAAAHPSMHAPSALLERFALSAGEAAGSDDGAQGDAGDPAGQHERALLELARIALHLRQDRA
jgi:hypothetical protein